MVIVDDSDSFLSAASALLKRGGLEVVGVAATMGEALGRVEELRPDVVLVDIVLAGESGFELARRLADRDHQRSTPASILISTHSEEDFADLIAESPARAFVPKSELSAEAIHRALDGASR